MSELESEHSSETSIVCTENSSEQAPVAAEKPPVSARRILANRLNALRSTGPKTSQGKTNSRRNARRHGLLAREIDLASSDEHDSPREYTRLLAERKHFQPLGVMEDFLVQKIATCFWGQKMALRATVGEASKQRKTAEQPSMDKKSNHQDIMSVWLGMMLDRERRRKDGSHNTQLTLTEGQVIKQVRKNLVGVLILRQYLGEIRDECKRTGAVSKAHRDLLRDCCGYGADLILFPLGYDATNSPEQVAEFLERSWTEKI